MSEKNETKTKQNKHETHPEYIITNAEMKITLLHKLILPNSFCLTQAG